MAIKNMIIMGPQASGKGTQADILAEKLGIPHMSIGELFREEVKSGSELGKKLKEFMDRGELVPQEFNDQIVRKMLDDNPDGILLDGYPRNTHQAKFLDGERKMDVVLVLDVPDEVCIERIGGRRVCDNGHEFHIKYMPSKTGDTCEHDGLPLKMRDDDKPEAIKKRLSIYHEQTTPIIEHYEQQGIVVHVDGTPLPEKVTELIFEKLGLQ